MSRLKTGVANDIKEKCHSAMIHDNMKISRVIVHA